MAGTVGVADFYHTYTTDTHRHTFPGWCASRITSHCVAFSDRSGFLQCVVRIAAVAMAHPDSWKWLCHIITMWTNSPGNSPKCLNRKLLSSESSVPAPPQDTWVRPVLRRMPHRLFIHHIIAIRNASARSCTTSFPSGARVRVRLPPLNRDAEGYGTASIGIRRLDRIPAAVSRQTGERGDRPLRLKCPVGDSGHRLPPLHLTGI